MHERVEEFVATARERHGLELEVREFPESGTPTAASAAEAIGCEVAQIVKSLVFEVDGRLVLALTSGANSVDEGALADHFEAAEVSMAEPTSVRETVGWSIGGVPPICHESDLPTVIDPTLRSFDRVWAAAGTPDAVFPIDPAELERLTDADAVDVTG